MVDAATEILLTLTQAARERCFRSPRTGKAVHVSQVYRWVSRGARAADGSLVRLEAIKLPGGLRTSREAIARFINALNAASPIPSPDPPSQSQCRDEAELRAAGFVIDAEGAGCR